MGKSLFIGNGLNRAISSDIAWGNLLYDIAGEYGVAYNKCITLPLEFENIANQILSRSDSPSPDIYLELKQKISKKIEKAALCCDAPHHEFTKLPVDSIFTTNYDYLLEKSLDPEFDYAKYPDSFDIGSDIYNLEINRKIAGKTIYHIHGEIKKPQTMCLGYEHYAGMLQNMRSKLRGNGKEKDLPVKEALLDESKTTDTWAEKFFTDDVDIVGFRLAECEIDMWWLLTYRAYLFYSDRDGMRKLINNTIVFYDVGTEPDKNKQYALENANVQYRFHKINISECDKSEHNEYYNAYFNIAKELKSQMDS